MSPPRKVIIGLTGNIATGKSTIMQLAAEKGATTIDADKVVHGVLAQNQDAIGKIVAIFGETVLNDQGGINRKALGGIVFADKAKLRQLEDVVLPATRDTIGMMIISAETDIVMVEAIKLLEGPLKDSVDQIWVTTCSEYVQIRRLIKYRGMAEDDAHTRVSVQAPQNEKIAVADVVIDTNGELSSTKAQFTSAWKQVEQLVISNE